MAPQLPRPALPSASIDLDGMPVAIHSLSRHQAITLDSFKGRPDEAEDYVLAGGLGITIEEAAEWRAAVSLEVAGQLIDAILELSGLAEPAPAPDDDDAEDGPDPKH